MIKKALFRVIAFAWASSSALGSVYIVNNSESGSVQTAGFVCSTCIGNYFAGYSLGQSQAFSNFFRFDLAGVSGNISAATFNVFTYGISGAAPFDVNGGTYGLFAAALTTDPIAGDSITYGSQIGTSLLSESNSYTTASITLNSAGFAFLNANEGGFVFIGGSLISAVGGSDYAFSGSDFTASNDLTITTTPEPSFFILPLVVLMLAALIRFGAKIRGRQGSRHEGITNP